VNQGARRQGWRGLIELDLDELDQISGGGITSISQAALAAAETRFPGISQKIIDGMYIGSRGASSWGPLITNIVGHAGDLAHIGSALLDPSAGHGAPGDIHVPAAVDPNGTITPGHFEPPGGGHELPSEGGHSLGDVVGHIFEDGLETKHLLEPEELDPAGEHESPAITDDGGLGDITHGFDDGGLGDITHGFDDSGLGGLTDG
jgi:hypothetical protein